MNKVGIYFQYISIALLSLFLVAFPLVFTTLATIPFVLPKQILLAGVTLLVFLLLAFKTVFDKTVRIRRTPYDIPLLLFLGVVLLGSVLAPNQAESLTAFATLFFSVFFYFLLTNTIKNSKSLISVILAFLGGAFLTSVWFALSFFKVYILPFSVTKSQLFTPLGSLLDLAVYTTVALVLGFYLLLFWKKQEKVKLKKLPVKSLVILGLFSLQMLVLVVGLGLTVYSFVKLQKPIILPFDTGFQTAFAAISQDTTRWILSFLLGSGFGTFASDFSRFKLSVFNQTPLWSITFFQSSNLILELLATTGVLGLISYLYLSYRVLKTRPLFIPFGFLVLLSFVLPFSPTIFVLFFIILGIHAALRGLSNKEFFDVQLALVTLKSGLVAVSDADKKEVKHGFSKILPFVVLSIVIVTVAFLGNLTVKYALANKTFQESLILRSQNKGIDTYNKQSQVVNLVPYSDTYQRFYSQTNLALANSLNSSTPKGSSPSAQTQQEFNTFLLQAINSARLATTLSPKTSANWQNLSIVYNALIGTKNADQFAIQTQQQAILLDPTNPQEYLGLGGIYYKLQLWDKAEEQFKIAINLKLDFPNAYYNLAHVLEQKGDLKGALEQLENVKTLVKNDPTNLKKVNDEIDVLKAGIKTQTPIQPAATLPVQNPPVAIPPLSTPKPTTTPTPVQ